MSEPSSQSSTPRHWETLARSAAQARSALGEDADLLRELLSFELDGSAYAVPVERVREIVRVRAITPVPRVPETVRGVLCLRGEIVQIVDLRRRLGLPVVEPGRASRIVVLHGDDGRIAGILVDRVREVLRVTEDTIRPTTPGEAQWVSELCVRGEEFVSIVDLDKVLDIDA